MNAASDGREPDDDCRRDPRPYAADRETIGQELGDDERDQGCDERDAAENRAWRHAERREEERLHQREHDGEDGDGDDEPGRVQAHAVEHRRRDDEADRVGDERDQHADEKPDHGVSQVKTTESAERSTGPWCTASTFVPSGSSTNAA